MGSIEYKRLYQYGLDRKKQLSFVQIQNFLQNNLIMICEKFAQRISHFLNDYIIGFVQRSD